MNCNKSKKEKLKHFLIISDIGICALSLGKLSNSRLDQVKDFSGAMLSEQQRSWPWDHRHQSTSGNTLLAKLFMCNPFVSPITLPSAQWLVCLSHQLSLPTIYSFSNSLHLAVPNSHLQLQKIFLSKTMDFELSKLHSFCWAVPVANQKFRWPPKLNQSTTFSCLWQQPVGNVGLVILQGHLHFSRLLTCLWGFMSQHVPWE